MRIFRLGSLVVLLTLLLPASPNLVHAAVPQGFESANIIQGNGYFGTDPARITRPTDLAFLQDGRLLITEQAGRIRVLAAETLAIVQTIDMSAVVCSSDERGILGIIPDPDFLNNNFIYLYYTYHLNPACDTWNNDHAEGAVNRVSRFTLSGIPPVLSNETLLIDGIFSVNGSHNGGDLAFGNDGKLYITVGDGGKDYQTEFGTGYDNDAPRDLNVLVGKVLRINRDGTIPPDNPFVGANTAPCNLNGRTDPGKICQETFSWGLRNPFRFAFDNDAPDTRFYINDVGETGFEEVNYGQAGADFGWPCLEANTTRRTTGTCNPTPQNMVAPIFSYAHRTAVPGTDKEGCGAITAAVFVPVAANWPAPYPRSYLFGDNNCWHIFRMSGAGTLQSSVSIFDSNAVIPVSMTFGPDNDRLSLYYLSYTEGLFRTRYTGSVSNRAPQAVITAQPVTGDAPLVVNFRGDSSSDPDPGDSISHSWNFGDGNTSTSVNPQHTYTARGTYEARLTVTDSGGRTGSATVRIDVGGPIPSIVEPALDVTFRVGQVLTLRASATDANGVPLSETDVTFTWVLIRHHRAGLPDAHTHPLLGPLTGETIQFVGPDPEDLDAASNSYIEVVLTAVDSSGVRGITRRNIQPRKIAMTVDTNPPGLTTVVNSTTFVGRQTFTSWEGYQLQFNAVRQGVGLANVLPQSWSNGSPSLFTVATGSTDETLVANFTRAYLCTLPNLQR